MTDDTIRGLRITPGSTIGDQETANVQAADARPEDYSGESVAIVPIGVRARTPEEASAKLDKAVAAVLEVLERDDVPAELATTDGWLEAYYEALGNTWLIIDAAYRRLIARRARRN